MTDLTGIGGITHSGRVYLPTITDKVTLEKPIISVEKEQPSQEKEDGSIFEKESQPIMEKKSTRVLEIRQT